MQTTALEWVWPSWRVPVNVRAVCTTRIGGNSRVPFDSFNLATHVGDEKAAVTANRQRLMRELNLCNAPRWLDQVHGNNIVAAETTGGEVTADGCFARSPNLACVVLTADCVPVLLCDERGTVVAAVHAGWRGLLAGVIEAAVSQLGNAETLIAWIGPAISGEAYRVKAELPTLFSAKYPDLNGVFTKNADQIHADLPALTEKLLKRLGVKRVSRYRGCVYADATRFFSFRREPHTGRMASLIWLS